MARRKNRPAEGLFTLLAVLPWWAGVVLAGSSYLGFHQLAKPPAMDAVGGIPSSAFMTHLLVASFAKMAQHLVPMICVGAAVASAWTRHERQARANNVVEGGTASTLLEMSWQEFEMLVGDAYRIQGFSVSETGGGGADGGVDLVLTKGRERTLVQCKQWRAYKVGVDVVRELYGVMAASGASAGIVVTSGRFTNDAKEFARGRNVELVEGPELVALIKRASLATKRNAGSASGRRFAPVTSAETRRRVQADLVTAAANGAQRPTSLACPACQSVMVRRVAKRGPNAGSAFWGCQSYPACTGTRRLKS